MKYIVNKFDLGEGVTERLNEWLDENEFVLFATHVYVDAMSHTATPILVVIAVDEGVEFEFSEGPRSPRGVSPAGENADPEAYRAWVNGRLDERANLPA